MRSCRLCRVPVHTCEQNFTMFPGGFRRADIGCVRQVHHAPALVQGAAEEEMLCGAADTVGYRRSCPIVTEKLQSARNVVSLSV